MKESAASVDFVVFPPWDILRGRDVFLSSSELGLELEDSDFSHWAPNCATFSRAREIPIKGVASPPAPLRSSLHPMGIPKEVAKMSRKARLRLEKDTEMADMAAKDCISRHKRGKWFSLEHPGRSIALDLPSWRELVSLEGVHVTRYHTCMFDGSSRRKAQVLIHNTTELTELGKTCESSHLCDRTNKPHHKWRPIVSCGRVTQFITGEEREYPVGFCQEFARLLRICFLEKGLKSFIEVFSGPNAPLSGQVAKAMGCPEVPKVETTKRGREFQSNEEVQVLLKETSHSKAPEKPQENRDPLKSLNLENAKASGRQPGFGKRKQLIPDGINDELKHLKEAQKLKHPFDSESGLKELHLEALDRRKSMRDPIAERERLLNYLVRLSKSERVRTRDKELKSLGSEGARRLGQKLNLGLMERVQELIPMEDKAVPLHCSTGLPIIGRAVESPFFVSYEEPQKVTESEFLNTCKRRRADTLRRTKFMGEIGGLQMAEAIWDKVQQEVSEGTMGPALSSSQLESKYGDLYNLIPSFGLRQGVNSRGLPKYRRIDDHTAGWTNLAAKRLQKIPMANADYIGIMIKSFSENLPDQEVVIGTSDMKAAYRQVPLPSDNLRFALTAVYNPHTKQVDVHEMFGQPFGAGHAVPNFYRLAEWFHRFLVRYFGIMSDHFFDDFWVIETKDCAVHAQQCLLQAAHLLGIVFDPEKTQYPHSQAEVLGVIFKTHELQTHGILHVLPKPSRVTGLVNTINSCLKDDKLSSAQAASIVGKFGFLCSTMFGKVGRCASLAVRSRQYSVAYDTQIDASLSTSLKLMTLFLETCPPRQIKCAATTPPQILYTDASDVPGRIPRYGLGGVLVNTKWSPPRLEHFSWAVPETLVDRWIPKATFMGQLEILACPVALTTWSSLLVDCRCIHFVDNDSASACLVKGYSPKVDSCELVGLYWLSASTSRVDTYIDRVESKSNLADGPSRFDDTILIQLKSKPVQPQIPQAVMESSVSSWFGL